MISIRIVLRLTSRPFNVYALIDQGRLNPEVVTNSELHVKMKEVSNVWPRRRKDSEEIWQVKFDGETPHFYNSNNTLMRKEFKFISTEHYINVLNISIVVRLGH